MLMIRLSRVGKKKQAEYRLIINEKHKDPWGDVLEFLGYYNPTKEPSQVDFKIERIKYWLSQGAQVSDTVRNLLIDQKIIEGEKIKPTGIKKMKKKDMKSGGKEKKSARVKAAKEEKPAEPKAEKVEDKKPEVKEEKQEEKVKPETEEKPEQESKEEDKK